MLLLLDWSSIPLSRASFPFPFFYTAGRRASTVSDFLATASLPTLCTRKLSAASCCSPPGPTRTGRRRGARRGRRRSCTCYHGDRTLIRTPAAVAYKLRFNGTGKDWYLLGSEALGLGLLGRREELVDLRCRRHSSHGGGLNFGRRRCRRQRAAAVSPRQIRLQVAELAGEVVARRRRLPPEFSKQASGTGSVTRQEA
jgi:hypothetical protein